MAAWEGRRSRVVVGWWWGIANSHAVEGVDRDGSRSGIATRGGTVERGFGWERSHDSIVDFIANGAILKKILKLLHAVSMGTKGERLKLTFLILRRDRLSLIIRPRSSRDIVAGMTLSSL